MTAGSISLDEFRSLVESFVDVSNKIDDQWHLDIGVQGAVYMRKRHVAPPSGPANAAKCYFSATEGFQAKRIESSPQSVLSLQDKNIHSSQEITVSKFQRDRALPAGSDEDDEDIVGDMETEAEDDGNCMPMTEAVSGSPLTYEYHVMYSESYNVPVLYFNIFTSDGKLLPLEKVWKLCPNAYHEYLADNKWATLTQQEHPLLGRPFLQLHPCHTADLMAQILLKTGISGRQNYLITWLSTVGPMVGLTISPEYMYLSCSSNCAS